MRISLTAKIIASVVTVLIVTVVILGYTGTEAMKSVSIEEAIAEADRLGETIIRTTFYSMMENNKERLSQELTSISAQKHVEVIRIINKNGKITFSTSPFEIGTKLDKKAAACNMCHFDHRVLLKTSSMSRSRIFTSPHGHKILAIAKAIYNQPSCSNAACHQHPPDQRILGVLDVELSLEDMTLKVASYRNRVAFIGIVLVVAVIIAITFLTNKLVSRPLKQLLEHTERVAQGSLDTYLDIRSNDELGELAQAFNRMTHNLKKAREELEEWGRTLELRVEERTKEVEKMQVQLIRAEKMASLGEMAAGIAHEINNPLTGVLSFAYLVHDDPKLPEELKEDLQVIIDETQRCAKIVKGLLEFSRASVPQKKEVNLNELIESVTFILQQQSSFFNIELIKELDPNIPKLYADPNQLSQVLMNIIINASHATPEGGRITIKTGIDQEEDSVFAEISDTGCGISEENLSRIFDPFFTTKSQGTGLGLAVSYGIVKNHGGSLDVWSEVGKGTTFIIHLPISEQEVDENHNDGSKKKGTGKPA